jgi:hypothetical protein
MKHGTHLRLVPLVAAFTAAVSGCGKSSDVVTMSDIASATVSGAVNSGSKGTLAYGNESSGGSSSRTFLASLLPIETAWAGTSCPRPETSVDGLNCSVDSTGKVMTLAYRSCNFGNNSAVWDGTEILSSSDPVSCGTSPSEAPGARLLRTFGPGTTRTVGSSVHVASIDTDNASGYERPVAGGVEISYLSTGREIEIKGVHVLSQKIFRGNGNAGRIQTEADHTVSTEKDKPLSVAVSNGTRVVNGVVSVQNNLDKYTGTAEFKDVTYDADSGCCLPQSGTLTVTMSGSRSGTETLTFSSSGCGDAKMEDEKGDLRDITLTRCF